MIHLDRLLILHESVNSSCCTYPFGQNFPVQIIFCYTYPSFESFVALILVSNLLLHSPFFLVALTLSISNSFHFNGATQYPKPSTNRRPWDCKDHYRGEGGVSCSGNGLHASRPSNHSRRQMLHGQSAVSCELRKKRWKTTTTQPALLAASNLPMPQIRCANASPMSFF